MRTISEMARFIFSGGSCRRVVLGLRYLSRSMDAGVQLDASGEKERLELINELYLTRFYVLNDNHAMCGDSRESLFGCFEFITDHFALRSELRQLLKDRRAEREQIKLAYAHKTVLGQCALLFDQKVKRCVFPDKHPDDVHITVGQLIGGTYEDDYKYDGVTENEFKRAKRLWETLRTSEGVTDSHISGYRFLDRNHRFGAHVASVDLDEALKLAETVSGRQTQQNVKSLISLLKSM